MKKTKNVAILLLIAMMALMTAFVWACEEIKPQPVEPPEETFPKITVGSIAKSGTVGKRIKLPIASAVDEDGTQLEVDVFLIDANGNITLLSGAEVTDNEDNAKGFTPKTKGLYRIRYYAQNQSFDFAQITYEITINGTEG